MIAQAADAMTDLQFDTFCSRLSAELSRPDRPQRPSSRFEPELSYGRHHGPPPVHARHAAVVILLYPHADEWFVPLTVRPHHLAEHAGQVSLPGGGRKPGEDSRQCALRELGEELGPATAACVLLGSLRPIYVFASNFLVEPFVAMLPARPEFQIAHDEVAELLEVPLRHLLDPGPPNHHEVRRRAVAFRAPHIEIDGHRVWGATGLILDEFSNVVREMAGVE